MRNLISTFVFAIVFVGLGFFAYLNMPNSVSEVADISALAPVRQVAVAAPAASPKLNDISLPLDVQSNFAAQGYSFDAQGLANNINSGTSSISQVLRWNTSTQTSDTWDPNLGFGFVGGVFTTTPFSLETGKAYRLLVTDAASTIYSLVGDVPVAGSIHATWVGSSTGCKLNHFMIPLDQSGITNADQLAASIGATGITQVLHWNATTQTSDTWDPALGFGFVNGGTFTTTPFDVQVGHPYWICANNTINGQSWPTP